MLTVDEHFITISPWDVICFSVKEHGPRMFRHADGSLQASNPPRDPLAVVGSGYLYAILHACLAFDFV